MFWLLACGRRAGVLVCFGILFAGCASSKDYSGDTSDRQVRTIKCEGIAADPKVRGGLVGIDRDKRAIVFAERAK